MWTSVVLNFVQEEYILVHVHVHIHVHMYIYMYMYILYAKFSASIKCDFFIPGYIYNTSLLS